MILPWVLVSVLTVALSLALGRLCALRASRPGPERRVSALLGRLAELQRFEGGEDRAAARERVCRLVADGACELMEARRASVMLPQDGDLVIAAHRGLPAEMGRTRLKPGEGVAGRVFAAGDPLYVTEPPRDPRYVALVDNRESREAVLSIPLRTGGRSAGVLNLHRTEGALPFNDLNLGLLSLLATEAARTLRRLDAAAALD